MLTQEYISKLNTRYKTGIAREHSYRGELQNLLETILPEILVTNEPARIKCGAPDYILQKKEIEIGFIEAKDIGDKDLEGKKKSGNKEQFDRYKASLGNLIFTDYLDFLFYKEGVLTTRIAIGKVTDNGIQPLTENFEKFENLIKDFSVHVGQTIKSPQKLALMMAGKARLLADVISKALHGDEESHEDSSLKAQMEAFKQILIHDITPEGFADVYAQTIAYGLFAARLHDPTLPTFSRQEAAELIPKTNPFLRKLFGYIAGPDIDDRIKWIVDNLIEIFLACDVREILKDYGKATKMEDPIIHFYETFLADYDPKLRKARGVWYTPAPVVNFIVRAVDDILKTEFGLKDGLADNSKTKIKVKTQTPDKRSKSGYKEVEKEVHKVQILDPATGTGTFLAEVVKHIYNKRFKAMQGAWSGYVENHLIPRLNGFELLMASYAMAHLQLDLLLEETGFKPTKNQRLKVFLTNSLEEEHPETGTLFASWLSDEANQANHIKRDTPVMCIIGNPPYSISSSNKSKWMESLVYDYKKDVGEQNLNALSDDYVKFLRYSQFLIDKNKTGIIAMVTNNSFIDGITQKKMRESLLKSFDKIYIYDLHGSAKRKENAPDGSIDQNIFDIQQGVSISLFIKKPEKSKTKEIFHFDSYGNREIKYEKLIESDIKSISWSKVKPEIPNYFFVPKDNEGITHFEKGFNINDFFRMKGNGIKFRKDNLLIKYHFQKEDVVQMLHEINHSSELEIYHKYDFEATKDWKVNDKRIFFIEDDFENIKRVEYRQFDIRYTYYPLESINQIIVRGDSRRKLMQHYLNEDNLGLVVGRQGQVVGDMQWNLAFITNKPTDMNIFYRGGGINFPLYLYPETTGQQTIGQSEERQPNLNMKIVEEIAQKLGLTFVPEKDLSGFGNLTGLKPEEVFAPIDLLDYIYAVLHSPNYREKYKEFLKIDFPRVPYPESLPKFRALAKLGAELRQIHLLESPKVEEYISSYPQDGSNEITTKIAKKDWELIENSGGTTPSRATNNTNDNSKPIGRIWINETQYFDNIPLTAWEFYIGGYQPAQKWLKDRRGRTLDFDDILHYQKIIVALSETDRIMKEIDKIEID